MRATRSLVSRRWPELAWAAFAAANVAVMVLVQEWQTVPFHLVWVSLTILYGFRVWQMGGTIATLVVVGLTTGFALWLKAHESGEGIDEMTEVPLMSAMFLAMVWHARRREAALGAARAAHERERDFIRDASHLLRTPITVARGHAELMAHGATGQDARDLDVIVGELDRLGRISSGLLLLAAAEHPDFTALSPLHVDDLVERTVRRWSRAARRDWRCETQADGMVIADEERLTSALDAVIENAVKHTEEGARITVRARPDDDGTGVAIEVADHGAGIPPELLPHVFERFARQTGTGRPGTGLGLPIVKAVVEAQGGQVRIVSALGQGTTVRLWLPHYEQLESAA